MGAEEKEAEAGILDGIFSSLEPRPVSGYGVASPLRFREGVGGAYADRFRAGFLSRVPWLWARRVADLETERLRDGLAGGIIGLPDIHAAMHALEQPGTENYNAYLNGPVLYRPNGKGLFLVPEPAVREKEGRIVFAGLEVAGDRIRGEGVREGSLTIERNSTGTAELLKLMGVDGIDMGKLEQNASVHFVGGRWAAPKLCRLGERFYIEFSPPREGDGYTVVLLQKKGPSGTRGQ